jgi:two-component system, NarL family, nitrate/nitrite response regulator NarL
MLGNALIVEDHPLYRHALAELLRVVLGDGTVHTASCAEEALRMQSRLERLRLIVLDFSLPGMSGTEAVTALTSRFPAADLIAVSASEERIDASAALRAGAKLFISKAVSTEVMTQAIQRVLTGEGDGPRWITPTSNDVLEPDAGPRLTPRQSEILRLLHLSNKEIGLRLGVAEITVKMHVSSLFRILGVANRTQAMQTARRLVVDGSSATGS